MENNINLLHGDCLELMKTIESGSVDLILTDPPYGTINTDGGRKMNINGWDNILDYDLMWSEINRVLRKNGKCILFSQEPFTSDLIKSAIPNVPFSMRAIWLKDNFANALGVNKNLVNFYEDICLFSKTNPKHDFEGFHPLRDYAKEVILFIGLNLKQINNKLNHRRAEHFFYVDSTQFSLCTENTYNELVNVFGIDKMQEFKEFYYLKIKDKEYRDNLLSKMNSKFPSIFNLPKGAKYKSNVFEYKKDYDSFHPTQKPVALLEDLIKTYSNENNLVLDFTFGSCSTGIACINTNRRFIGIEKDDKYFDIAKNRIEQHIPPLL